MVPDSDAPLKAAEVRQWIALARGGDREAVDRLLQACRLYLLHLANQEVPDALRAKVAPSDIVQETHLDAFRDFAHFAGSTEEELRAWLRGILLHNVATARTRFGALKRDVAREVPLEKAGPAQPSPGETPSKEAQAQERDQALEDALARLPEHYRQVIALRQWEGLTFAQVGARLDRSEEAARKLWARAIELLRESLESPDESG
jgi:RNA polymerase sigma-70 factor (ECF subfamily)